ncbi:MAG: hypothetical protein AAGA75_24910 [Cyanobacteria bacterium P01_E01_bin.6]
MTTSQYCLSLPAAVPATAIPESVNDSISTPLQREGRSPFQQIALEREGRSHHGVLGCDDGCLTDEARGSGSKTFLS